MTDRPDLNAATRRVAESLGLGSKPEAWLTTWDGMGWLLDRMGGVYSWGLISNAAQPLAGFWRHDSSFRSWDRAAGRAEHVNPPSAVLLAADQALGGSGDAEG